LNVFHTNLASPKKFTSRKAIADRIQEYFVDYCEKDELPPTVTGLAFFLGMTRKTLLTYSKDEKFADIIELAKAYIETKLDERVSSKDGTSSNQFVLRENFGWKANGSPEVNISLTQNKLSISSININALPEEDKTAFLTGRLSLEQLEKKFADTQEV
jgi:hypothetical protein